MQFFFIFLYLDRTIYVEKKLSKTHFGFRSHYSNTDALLYTVENISLQTDKK